MAAEGNIGAELPCLRASRDLMKSRSQAQKVGQRLRKATHVELVNGPLNIRKFDGIAPLRPVPTRGYERTVVRDR